MPATCGAVRDADFTETVSDIKVPVLCIVGDQDGSTPPDLVRSTADLIPGARFEVIAAGRPHSLRRAAGSAGRAADRASSTRN